MSKPKPGLGKGIVRTLAHHHHHQPQHALHTGAVYLSQQQSSTFAAPLSLAPSVSSSSYQGFHSIAGPSRSQTAYAGSQTANGWTFASSQGGGFASLGLPATDQQTPAYLPLVPAWDADSPSANQLESLTSRFADVVSVVQHYVAPVRLPQLRHARPVRHSKADTGYDPPSDAFASRTHGRVAYNAIAGPSTSTSATATRGSRVRARHYTHASSASRDAYQFAQPAQPGGTFPVGESTPAVGAAPPIPPSILYDVANPPWQGKHESARDLTGDNGVSSAFFTNTHPPPPPPPSPPPSPPPARSGSASSSPRPPSSPALRGQRADESHVVLSPLAGTETDPGQTLGLGPTVAALPPPYLAFPSHADSSPIPIPQNLLDTQLSSTYASDLVFRFGAAGLPKERVQHRSPPPGRTPPPLPPPRPRSFALPQVDSPKEPLSIGVGEDAYFARADGMCVADGVGGWAKSGRGGADASRWSRLLTHFCETELSAWWAGADEYVEKVDEVERRNEAERKMRKAAAMRDEGLGGSWAGRIFGASVPAEPPGGTSTLPPAQRDEDDDTAGLQDGCKRRRLDPVEIMQRGFEKCLACVLAEGLHGSSTCLLALLHHSTLLIANLGDCCLLLIRNGEVVFRTSEMQHGFNFPLQVGTHSRDEPMKDAKGFEVGVEKEDIVVLGSDGLMDNLFDEDILDVLADFAPPEYASQASSSTSSSLPKPPPSRPSTSSGLPPFNPQKVSEALCRKARTVSELTTATTPFMVRAIEEGIDFVGGKKDDISVIVGVIGHMEPLDLPVWMVTSKGVGYVT